MKADLVEKAIKELQSLPENIKEEHFIINLIASAFVEMGKNEEALQLLTTKVGRKRKMDELLMASRYLMGVAYKNVGNNKKALVEFKKVYAENIGYLDVDKLIKELEEQLTS